MSREPDEFDLELLEAGAEVDDATRARLADPAFDPARRELAELRDWWSRHRPPLRAPPPRRPTWLAGLAAAAAAAILLAVVAPSLVPDEPAFQARGGAGVDWWRVRAGDPLDPRAPTAAGDQLGLSLVVEEPGYVTVYALQEDGGRSLLVDDAPAEPTEPLRVPAIRLDGYAGREWLVVEVRPGPSEPPEAVELLPDPSAHAGADRWVLEVTRGRSPR